ncbi:prepilin-type cleavage/methylation domain-containing protein [Helicobacter burdigaliensis]|uniref:prepilin-type cleavage/methylation domain-containing protein n=1 Tax=Helicobacter burdigaliensis TaxID=2315334 RepID=UPI0018E5324F|nr:prepilin-type cleavage/methylation domain-containing protein [Helicobacter burdigaliensis]
MSAKSSFTLLECLLIIALLAILSTISLNANFKSDLILAQDEILKHLYYTKFLALNSQKHIRQSDFCQSDFCKEEMERYKESFWRIQFSELKNIGVAYSIFSDSARIKESKNYDDRPMDSFEYARDLVDSKYLGVYNYNNTKFANPLRDGNFALSSRYKISKVVLKGCGESFDKKGNAIGVRILFDNLGRVYCKIPKEKVSPLQEQAIFEIFDFHNKSAKICITPRGIIKKC